MGESFVILWVGDARVGAAAVAQLEERSWRVLHARDVLEGLQLAAIHDVDLFLATLPDAHPDPLELVREVRNSSAHRYKPAVLLTPEPGAALRLEAARVGADDVLRADAAELLLARAEWLGELKRVHDAYAEEKRRLTELSITDGLTQVQNHRFFHDRLHEEFRRAQRYDDPLSLILIDLDHFKAVNDQHGHPVGDQVLRDVAQCLKRSVRETDLLARYGGEEFAVLLPKTHLAGSLTVAERIWADVGRLRSGPDGTLQVTASLGVSSFPSRSVLNAEQLIQTADDALYRAKREGRNKICLFQQATFLPSTPTRAKAG